MAKLKLKGRDLRKLGMSEGKAIGIAINQLNTHYKRNNKNWVLSQLKSVLEHPDNYIEDKVFGPIVQELMSNAYKKQFDLKTERAPFSIFGEDQIDDGAKQQLYTALRLPIAKSGALMPDAHHGYGLPIGGVLATENAVIPYGVGVDIGCRMCLSVFDMPVEQLDRDKQKFKRLLGSHTRFGGKEVFEQPNDHEIFEREAFSTIPIVKSLKDKAWRQLGTSGGGNHFVEFGIVEIKETNNEWNLAIGKYLALLSHSGSRGLGAKIANTYTKRAKQLCPLPKGTQHLAWLSLDSHDGQEYWMAMQLAGDYASACHHDIHNRMAQALGEKPIARVENHHNFAWKEIVNGEELIVHRKGATPAGKDVLGIIPGSMTAPGYIVRGRGEQSSLQSASHGAGRQMSRTQAKNSLNEEFVKNFLKDHGIELIGGGLDEAPMAYKDINQVMRHQQDLVDILGLFYPKIVRMEG